MSDAARAVPGTNTLNELCKTLLVCRGICAAKQFNYLQKTGINLPAYFWNANAALPRIT